jgi:hypothetical protein
VGLLFVVLIHGWPHHNIPFVGSLDHSAAHATQGSGR